MDPRKNPYSPGAGTPPPELAGRGEAIERASIELDRARAGLSSRGIIFYGLRGVGKTVLLNRVRLEAESRGFYSVPIEAPEHRSLPALLVPALRSSLIQIDRGQLGWTLAKQGLRVLAGFANALRVKYSDIEFGFDYEPEPGLGDSGDLDRDLSDLLVAVGGAAAERQTAVVLYIDELQYVPEEQLAALIRSLHDSLSQRQLPITMVAAGLPQLLGRAGRAKSYAERLFEFLPIGPLTPDAAETALCIPAGKENVTFERSTIEEILRQTQCYPYFLQEWGKHTWNLAESSPVRYEYARQATHAALAQLDASFFRVRFDRLTPIEKRYMRAMAELGPGPHRSGDIADKLGRPVSSVAPTRGKLLAKGMIFSPAHGDTAFTVPLFDGFMKRIMPELV